MVAGTKRARQGEIVPPSFKLEDAEAAAKHASAQAAMWRTGELCDVSVKAGGKSVSAHRVVLASASAYFRRLFGEGGAGVGKSTVEVPDVDGDALALTVTLVYTGRVEVEDAQVDSFVHALRVLDMGPLLGTCTDAIASTLTPGSSLAVWTLASDHHLDSLAAAALRLAAAQFAAAAEEPDFVKIPFQLLRALVARDELHADEAEVLDAVLRWVRFDEAGRAHHLEELLPLVRFPLMAEVHVTGAVSSDPLVARAKCWPALLEEAKAVHGLPLEARETHASPRARGRGEKCWQLYSLGGMDGRCVMDSVQKYAVEDGMWHAVPRMGTPRVGHGAAVHGGQVYAVGGSDGTHRLSSVERFCPWRGTWENLTPMSTPRGDVGVAWLEGKLYAVGGRTHVAPLATAERLCPETGRWEPIASMSMPRYHVRVAVVEGQLYAVGGGEQTRVNGCTTVERFDPRRGVWESIPSMSTSREGVAIAVLDGKLYASGGYDGHDKLRSAERFDPVKGEWEAVAPMIAARMSHRAAVLGGHIYVLGGYKGDGECHPYDPQGRLSSAERYSPEKNEWEAVPRMSAEAAKPNSRFHSHGAVVVV